MVELLLARGACTDPVTCCGTPLHIAATEGQDRAMKILLRHNADVSLRHTNSALTFIASCAILKFGQRCRFLFTKEIWFHRLNANTIVQLCHFWFCQVPTFMQ